MSPEQKTPSILEYSAQLTLLAVDVMAQKGEVGGFLQSFDPEPNKGGDANQFTEERLDREAAHRLIAERIDAGFSGIAAFVCFESEEPQLYGEAVDSRPDVERNPDTARSVAVFLPLKKNWRGKWVGTIEGVAIQRLAD